MQQRNNQKGGQSRNKTMIEGKLKIRNLTAIESEENIKKKNLTKYKVSYFYVR